MKLWISTGDVQTVEKATGLGDGDCHLSTEGRKKLWLWAAPAVAKYVTVVRCLAPSSLYLVGLGWGVQEDTEIGNKVSIRRVINAMDRQMDGGSSVVGAFRQFRPRTSDRQRGGVFGETLSPHGRGGNPS